VIGKKARADNGSAGKPVCAYDQELRTVLARDIGGCCGSRDPEASGVDRIYLNVYVPQLQREVSVVGFSRYHRGHQFVSSALHGPDQQELRGGHGFVWKAATDYAVAALAGAVVVVDDYLLHLPAAPVSDPRRGPLFRLRMISIRRAGDFRSQNRPSDGA
jgi:hypothetical protein